MSSPDHGDDNYHLVPRYIRVSFASPWSLQSISVNSINQFNIVPMALNLSLVRVYLWLGILN